MVISTSVGDGFVPAGISVGRVPEALYRSSKQRRQQDGSNGYAHRPSA